MPSIINASTTPTSGLVQTADASGILQLQSNGTTGLTVGSGGVVTAANGIIMNTMTLGTAVTGEFEYDGGELYFTPLGTQRGIVPSMQYYRLNSDLVGVNSTNTQNLFGVGVTLSSNTVYAFEFLILLSKTAGATSHFINLGFGGTATVNNIVHQGSGTIRSTALPGNATTVDGYISNTAALSRITTTLSTAISHVPMFGGGTVSINSGGTFIPQYSLSNAPGGAYSTAAASYFLIYPIGTAGSNTSVGTWA